MSTTVQDRIAIIRDFLPRLRGLLAGLSDEQLTTAYLPGEWTIAQNVHHLLDAHVNSYLLFKRVLTEEQPQLAWPDQDAVADLPDGCSPRIESSLMALEGLHIRWTETLEAIQDWSKAGTSLDSGKTYTLDDLLSIYSRHCNNHIQQIMDVLDAHNQ